MLGSKRNEKATKLKKIITVLLAAFMMTAMTAAPVAAEEKINLAYEKEYWFTKPGSNEVHTNINRSENKITDGEYTKGTSASGIWEWEVVVDLGAKYAIDEIKLWMSTTENEAINFTAGVSLDGETWEKVGPLLQGDALGYNINDNEKNPGYIYDTVFTARKARYVKIFDSTTHNYYGHEIAEIEIYQSSKETKSNIAYGKSFWFTKPGSNEKHTNINRSDNKITDGEYTKGTSASGIWEWESVVDLGEEYTIDEIKLWMATTDNGAIDFTAGVSLDGETWENVGALSKGDALGYNINDSARNPGYIYDTVFTAKKARYVKIFDSTKHNNCGHEIAEIEIYGVRTETRNNVAYGKEFWFTAPGSNEKHTNINRSDNKITDGEYTKGTSASGIWEWEVVVDLGAKYAIDEIKLWMSTTDDETIDFTAGISLDGETWEKVGPLLKDEALGYNINDSARNPGYIYDTVFTARKARYVKIFDSTKHNNYGHEIAEIEIYESSKETKNNIAYGKSFWFTNVGSNDVWTNINKPDNKITDGEYTNGTGASAIWNYEAVVDLGAEYAVDEIKLWMSTSNRTALHFSVGVSLDGETWEEVDFLRKGSALGYNINDRTNHPAYIYNALFTPRKARYVKILDPITHTNSGYFIAEIEIYKSNEEARKNVASGAEVNVYGFKGNALNMNNGKLYQPALASQIADGSYYEAVSANGEYNWGTQLELKDTYVIDKVRVAFGEMILSRTLISPETFCIYVSEDGKTYKDVGNLKITQGSVCEVDFEPMPVKYIRLADPVKHTSDSFNIYEIEAFETVKPTVLYYTDNSAVTSKILQNGSVKSVMNAADVDGGIFVTAVYDKDNKLVLLKKTDIFDGKAENTIDLSKSIVGSITRSNLVAAEDLNVTAKLLYLNSDEEQTANMLNGQVSMSASYAIDGIKGLNESLEAGGMHYAMGSGQYTGRLRIDLGEACPATCIKVHYKYSAKDYEIKISEDGETWQSIYAGTKAITNDCLEVNFDETYVRYVDIVDNDTTEQQAVYEVEIFEPQNDYKISSFIWDSLNVIKPLANVFALEN